MGCNQPLAFLYRAYSTMRILDSFFLAGGYRKTGISRQDSVRAATHLAADLLHKIQRILPRLL